MNTVLDRPTILDVLDETILDATAKCSRCDGDAEYRVRDTCCNRAMNVCGIHESELNAKWSMQIIITGGIKCTRCRSVFVRVEDAVLVVEI